MDIAILWEGAHNLSQITTVYPRKMKKWTLAAFDESEAYPELVWGGFPKVANLSALVKVSASMGVILLIFKNISC